MKNLTIKQKLYSLNIGILLTMVIMVSFTVYKVIDIENEYNHMESQASAGKVHTIEINKELNYLSRLTRDIMIGNDYDGNIVKIDNTVSTIVSLFESLDKVTIDSQSKQILVEAQDETMKFVKYSQLLMKDLRSKKRDIKTLQNTYKDYKQFGSPLAKKARESFNKLVDLKTKELETISKQVHSSISTIKFWLPLLVVLNIIMIIFIYLGVRSIVSNIQKVENGLFDFFGFLNRTNENATTLDIRTNDEIGKMADAINKNISIVETGLLKDAKVMDEATVVAEKALNGFYTYKISASANNVQLEDLRLKINLMNDTTNKNLSDIIESLISFGNADFTRVSKLQSSGNIGSLTRGTNAVGASISEVMGTIANTSDKINKSADTLASTSEELSTAANEQASSLEETAASIEEITSTIRSTVDKSHQMGEIAIELKDTSTRGNKLASDTATAMDEINSATTEIEDAITIIDQIAFQTNILSLNAAVEAATAGEAGKGFAVVAGEVRNLAARSAEAANEIKALVNKASSRATEGKIIADEMMNGYIELNDKVEITSSLISEVEGASKEQMAGMDQINTAVSQLDQSTQENAAASATVSSEAMGLSTITNQLVSVINRTTFDETKRNTVCDVDLTFDTTKLKLDHISFKENNFKRIGNGESWKVVDHHNCNLGKWIDEHKNESYASSSAWQELLKVHEHVHSGVQEYIDTDAKDMANKALMDMAKGIESDTISVFNQIDKLKEIRCSEMRNNASKEMKRQVSTKKVIGQKAESVKKTTPEKPNPIVQTSDDEWDSF